MNLIDILRIMDSESSHTERSFRKTIKCVDGTTMTIDVGTGSLSEPPASKYENLLTVEVYAPYNDVYSNYAEVPNSWTLYCDEFGESLYDPDVFVSGFSYGYVPVEELQEYLDSHGGIYEY